MPYITRQERRRILDGTVLYAARPQTAGELNFAISVLCREFTKTSGEGYSTFNTIIGALECAKLEYYRRLCAGYEDHKRKENGDVYF